MCPDRAHFGEPHNECRAKEGDYNSYQEASQEEKKNKADQYSLALRTFFRGDRYTHSLSLATDNQRLTMSLQFNKI